MRLHFSNVSEELKQLFAKENIELGDNFFNKILKFLSSACNYEEEEVKIKPSIYITKNLKHNMTNIVTIPIVKEDGCEGKKYAKTMKSLVPFCNLGWSVYIDVSQTNLEYGIIRFFSGPTVGSIIETFSYVSDPSESAMLEISVISSYEIMMKGMNENTLCLDFRLFHDEKENTVEDLQLQVAQDIASGIEDAERNRIANKLLLKLLKLTRQKVHGTILLVVKEDYDVAQKTYITDFTWLDAPIDLIETGLIVLSGSTDVYTSEKYYGLSGLFMEMMNVDGITIIDNAGRVRGFNVFVNQLSNGEASVSGGARKRAMLSLLDTKDPSIIGVYFQSQDGHIVYERMNINA